MTIPIADINDKLDLILSHLDELETYSLTLSERSGTALSLLRNVEHSYFDVLKRVESLIQLSSQGMTVRTFDLQVSLTYPALEHYIFQSVDKGRLISQINESLEGIEIKEALFSVLPHHNFSNSQIPYNCFVIKIELRITGGITGYILLPFLLTTSQTGLSLRSATTYTYEGFESLPFTMITFAISSVWKAVDDFPAQIPSPEIPPRLQNHGLESRYCGISFERNQLDLFSKANLGLHNGTFPKYPRPRPVEHATSRHVYLGLSIRYFSLVARHEFETTINNILDRINTTDRRISLDLRLSKTLSSRKESCGCDLSLSVDSRTSICNVDFSLDGYFRIFVPPLSLGNFLSIDFSSMRPNEIGYSYDINTRGDIPNPVCGRIRSGISNTLSGLRAGQSIRIFEERIDGLKDWESLLWPVLGDLSPYKIEQFSLRGTIV